MIAFDAFKLKEELAYQNATVTIKSIENKVTGEVRTLKEYTNLILPKFEYTPSPEIDSENLGDSLPINITGLIDIETIKECKTFKEVHTLLDNSIADANAVITKIVVPIKK